MNRTFGAMVRARRLEGGKAGVRGFAKKLDISPATLSRVENGGEPDLKTFFKVCGALWFDPAFFAPEFLGRSNPEETTSNKSKES